MQKATEVTGFNLYASPPEPTAAEIQELWNDRERWIDTLGCHVQEPHNHIKLLLNRLEAAEKENRDLCEDYLEMKRFCKETAKGELYQQRRAEAAEAKIDALMLEYCPDEMTDEQLKRWGECQVPVPEEELQAALDKHS